MTMDATISGIKNTAMDALYGLHKTTKSANHTNMQLGAAKGEYSQANPTGYIPFPKTENN